VSDPFAAVATVRLRPGRDASVRRRHPWLYRGALAAPLAAPAGPVQVCAAGGERLGVALPGGSGGALALRMVSFGDENWDAAALRARLARALALRRRLALDSEAFRLVHAEGDELPGLVVDVYGSCAVAEPFERAWEPYLGELAEWLATAAGVCDVVVRPAWGAEPARAVRGRLPEDPVFVREGAVYLAADLVHGQKTGLFLDQRDNRRRLASLARGMGMLNLFSYSGAFAVTALAAGARRAINVDASRPALELARLAYRRNGLAVAEEDFVAGDAFEIVRARAAAGERHEIVVVDPPAFVKRAADRTRGLAGYRDINLFALRLVAPGGLLLTCSCSALVSEEQFGQALFAAALDVRRSVRVLARWGAAPDHPVALTCPETRHLKAWLCAVA
jgi:23S rRNA (cytosine1962-C5)-methyltransferase